MDYRKKSIFFLSLRVYIIKCGLLLTFCKERYMYKSKMINTLKIELHSGTFSIVSYLWKEMQLENGNRSHLCFTPGQRLCAYMDIQRSHFEQIAILWCKDLPWIIADCAENIRQSHSESRNGAGVKVKVFSIYIYVYVYSIYIYNYSQTLI